MNALTSDLAPTGSTQPASTPFRRSTKQLSGGLWLITLGLLWLLWNFRTIHWSWMESYGFVIVGAVFLFQTIASRQYRLLLGSWFILIGLFHILISYTDFRIREIWPVYVILTGLAFFIHFAADPRRWFSLLCGMLGTGFGVVYLSRTLFLLPHHVAQTLLSYWPLSFVAAGLVMIALALWHQRKK